MTAKICPRGTKRVGNKCVPIHKKEQQTILVDLPKAGELKPFTTKADRDRLIKERFQELDLKEKGWKRSSQYKKDTAWGREDNIQIQIVPAPEWKKGKHEVMIWKAHPYKSISRRTFPSETQAKNYAIKWMKEHPVS